MSRFLFALTVTLLLAATSAQAQVQRAFVSALTGNDANTATNCQATAPCRWFAGAISVVASGGEIVAMDSGAYGTVTITKSISIIGAPGVYAGITVFSGNGITIATAGVKVVLRGLTINRLGGSGIGILMTAGDSLVVDNCTVTNFGNTGLEVDGPIKVRLLDSLLQGNDYGADLINGATVLVSNSRFIDNVYFGLRLYASGVGVKTRGEVTHSLATGNGSFGFAGIASSSGQVELNIKDSVAGRNGSGVVVGIGTGSGLVSASVSASLISGNTFYGLSAYGSGIRLVASGNTATHNYTGFAQDSSAVFQSTGDNTLTDNTTAPTGTITPLSKI